MPSAGEGFLPKAQRQTPVLLPCPHSCAAPKSQFKPRSLEAMPSGSREPQGSTTAPRVWSGRETLAGSSCLRPGLSAARVCGGTPSRAPPFYCEPPEGEGQGHDQSPLGWGPPSLPAPAP